MTDAEIINLWKKLANDQEERIEALIAERDQLLEFNESLYEAKKQLGLADKALAHLRTERDAAVADLENLAKCAVCKHYLFCRNYNNAPYCYRRSAYEWRGPQEPVIEKQGGVDIEANS